jgi:hypothetical protein
MPTGDRGFSLKLKILLKMGKNEVFFSDFSGNELVLGRFMFIKINALFNYKESECCVFPLLTKEGAVSSSRRGGWLFLVFFN